MAPKTITVVDASGGESKRKLSTEDGYRNLLRAFGVSWLMDSEQCGIDDFESLVDGGKYTPGELRQQPAQVEQLKAQLKTLDAQLKTLDAQLKTRDAQFDARDRLANGTFFAQMNDVIDYKSVSYEGGFKEICARFKDKKWIRNRFQAYNNLVSELTKKVNDATVQAEDLTLESQSVSNQSLGTKSDLSREEKGVKQNREKDKIFKRRQSMKAQWHGDDPDFNAGVLLIRSGTETNSAHLLSGNPTCSPTMGILVQAFVGKDFEADMDKQIRTANNKIPEDKGGKVEALRAKKIKILQQLAYHKRDPYKGFINLEHNWVQVPKQGHEKFFDEGCNWIIVPVMPLKDILEWHHEKGEYWVMFIAGSLTEEPDYPAYRNLIQAPLEEDIYVDGERERCTESEVRDGIETLCAFVRALADLATGRGENKLTPLDLILGDKKPNELTKLEDARDDLQKNKEVKVPKMKQIDFNDNPPEILKLRIRHKFETSKVTEPMAFAAKGALNFMSLTGEKATPACGEPKGDEEDSDEEDSESSVELSPIVAPMTPRPEERSIPQSVTVVTPPSPSQLERSSSCDSWDL